MRRASVTPKRSSTTCVSLFSAPAPNRRSKMRSGSPMRLLFIGALLIAGSPARSHAQPVSQGVADERIDRVEQWLVSALHHEAGGMDEAALAVAMWSNADLQTFWIDLRNLIVLLLDVREGSFETTGEHRRPTRIDYTRLQLARMRDLA